MMTITSTANAKVKELVSLRKKKKYREESGCYLVEGSRMFGEADPAAVRAIYVTAAFAAKEAAALAAVAQPAGVRPIVLADPVFQYAADTRTPQGVLCVLQQQTYTLEQLLTRPNPCLLMLEGLQDPGNVGTILRSGEGAGIAGVILSRDCADIYNPKTIRATMGSVYRVPFVYVDDFCAAIDTVRDRQIRTYATHLDGAAVYDALDYAGPCAFLIGNEGNGLSAAAAARADALTKIPMLGRVESLNAAIAATILMFEAARQRRR